MYRIFFKMILRCKICYCGSRDFIGKKFSRGKPIVFSRFYPKAKFMVLQNCLFHKKICCFYIIRANLPKVFISCQRLVPI
jgi:hypothetical protein